MGAKSFKDLIVWQKAHQFVLDFYRFSKVLPKEEIYGITSQARRSAVSVPANIAEGFKKFSNKDKQRFYNIAQESLEETKYYLILIQDLEYGNTEELQNKLEEVSKILDAFQKSLSRKEISKSEY